MCQGRTTPYMEDKLIPTFNRETLCWVYKLYINPYYWLDEFIPFNMETMGSLDAQIIPIYLDR